MPFVRQSTLDRWQSDRDLLQTSVASWSKQAMQASALLKDALAQIAALTRTLAAEGVPAPPLVEPMPSVEQVDRKLARDAREAK